MDGAVAITIAIGALFVLGVVAALVYVWRNSAWRGGGDQAVADEMFNPSSKFAVRAGSPADIGGDHSRQISAATAASSRCA